MKQFLKELIFPAVLNVGWWYVFSFFGTALGSSAWWAFPTFLLFVLVTVGLFVWLCFVVMMAYRQMERKSRGY